MSVLRWALNHLLSHSDSADRVTYLEVDMTEQSIESSELSAGLAEIGEGLDKLAQRIEALPDDPSDITAEQLAEVKTIASRVNALAVASPEIPTPAPVEPVPEDPTPVDPTPVDPAF